MSETPTPAPLNLTYGKVRAQITAIVEKTFPVPRGEDCLPIGDMERALAEHVQDLILAVYAETDAEMRRLCGSGDRAEVRATEEAERRSKAERALWAVRTVPCWTNEDGKRFVFADDLVAAIDPDLAELSCGETQEASRG